MQLDGRSICIVMMSALGDTVHVLPVICAIKRHAPSARVAWVLEPPGARLMTGHPLVDEVLIHRRGLTGLRELIRETRERRFDLLVDLQVALKAGLATLFLPATVKLGFDRERARDLNWLFTTRRIPPHAPQHVQDQYFEFLDWLSVPRGEPEWLLGPWPGEGQLAPRALHEAGRRCAGLVIGTSWEEKDWIASRWAELADELYFTHGLQPVLVGGSSEKESTTARQIVAASRAPLLSTLGCSLRELVSVLDACALVVSPDTAPLHMCVALDVPVIALMGYTNPLRVGPYRRFTDLLVDAYGEPGESYSPSLEYRPARMELIRVADVLEKVAIWKERYAGRTPRQLSDADDPSR